MGDQTLNTELRFHSKVTLCVALARGLFSCGLPQKLLEVLKLTATQGPAWPRPIRSPALAFKPTWNNLVFLQGQGQGTELHPPESVGMRAKWALLISAIFPFAAGCLLQYLLLFLALPQELLQQKGA